MPGALRCGSLGAKKRNDGLCSRHGRMKDSGKEIVLAVSGAPTFTQAFQCWQNNIERRADIHAARFKVVSQDEANAMSLVQWEILLYLHAWYLYGDGSATS